MLRYYLHHSFNIGEYWASIKICICNGYTITDGSVWRDTIDLLRHLSLIHIFSNISATVGNDISTFPDYPADIRAPQGSLTGVSGFQVHIGAGKVFTPGDKCDVLVAMNEMCIRDRCRTL